MTRRRLMLLAVLAALTLAAPAWGKATPLAGTVGPGFTISLKKAGAKVTTLRRGSYAITVNDRSDFHNFRLRGPGVNKAITTVGFVGRKSVTVTLRPGRYTFLCDPHSIDMRGTFRVT
jgi:plastocyanin